MLQSSQSRRSPTLSDAHYTTLIYTYHKFQPRAAQLTSGPVRAPSDITTSGNRGSTVCHQLTLVTGWFVMSCLELDPPININHLPSPTATSLTTVPQLFSLQQNLGDVSWAEKPQRRA
ncbi:hypothetical protein PCASD_14817 [Puccinia coronata f. sp. avenae]|uniref:Uncharacterized protein n=1 Tax=Puccinia coronata f. sp. avenae TaxID=200324 RepID=A0A2N5TCI5_9BASI|nr:hypothetical protein PCASD_14817 [Puccinia coronata f. sp. avenae]